ncbi:hypothetical protein ACS0TY_013587 [Phlomoides rotata]
MLLDQYINECVGIIGDFNSIRDESRRIGKALREYIRDIKKNCDFIESSNLTEISLRGKKFTWYRLDGSCKSKLDIFLVYGAWLNKWPNCTLKGGARTVSDHQPIYIEEIAKDWGPKSFRFFSWWLKNPSFIELVDEKWNS